MSDYLAMILEGTDSPEYAERMRQLGSEQDPGWRLLSTSLVKPPSRPTATSGCSSLTTWRPANSSELALTSDGALSRPANASHWRSQSPYRFAV